MNFPVSTREVLSGFQYDNSNRLLGVYNFPKFYSPLENFSYDKDGNLQTLTRDYSGDNFSYQYYSGTSKLKSIDGGGTMHYSYDYNGNVTDDLTRNVSGISYDSRNLPVEMTITPFTELNNQYKVKYRYDESGNRIRKMLYKKAVDEKGSQWMLLEDKVYIHPVTGEEYAVYNSGNIDYYNIYAGSELICKKKITPGGKESSSTIYYYFKDHLGNIRAVIDGTSGTITQAQDYDAWGDICRTYTSAIDTTVNKFTGKERDHETGYDYFGARYYDSRIGRWLQTEPLLEKYFQYSQYCYGLNNPIYLIDPDGMRISATNINLYDKTKNTSYLSALINDLSYITGLKLNFINGYIEYEKDEKGNPVINGGSQTARDILLSLISNPNDIILFIEMEYSSDAIGNQISLNPNQINEFVNGAIKGGLNEHTLGWAMVFLHESLHTNIGGNLTDPDEKKGDGIHSVGEVEAIMNKVRNDMGEDFGERMSYAAYYFEKVNMYAFPFSEKSKNDYDNNASLTGDKNIIAFKTNYKPRFSK